MKLQKTTFRVSALVGVSAFLLACANSATTGDFGGSGGTRDASGGSSSDGASASSDAGSSSSGGGDDGGDDSGSSSSGGGSSGGGTSSSGGGSGSSGGSGGGTPMSDSDCQAMMGTMCVGCCQQLHAPGPTTLFNAIQSCVCGDGGGCASVCATEYCQMAGKVSSMNDPCETCVNNQLVPDAGGPCATPVNNACQADSSCTAYLTCAQGCH